MELNDGTQTIEGIEYFSIKHLNIENIEPGCKVGISVFCFYQNGVV